MVTANNSVFKMLKVAACAGTLSFLLPTIVFAEDAQQVASAENFIQDSEQSYGPIIKSDTLWKIAVANRPDTTVSNYQVMMALFENNPNAFLRNDINTMVTGQFLRIPSIEEIRKIAPYPYQPINTAKTAQISVPEEPMLVVNESVEVPEGQVETELAVIASVTQDTINQDQNDQDKIKQVDGSQHKQPQQLLDENHNATNSVAVSDNVNNDESIAEQPISDNDTTGLTNLQAENTELKESLNAVDDQLSYLQYEVAKASEYQTKMDDKLSEQNKLLSEAKQREQRLITQQQKLSQQQQGFFNNPISYWSINGLLAILVIVLFILVFRRRQVEKTLKAQIAANTIKTDKNYQQNNKSESTTNVVVNTEHKKQEKQQVEVEKVRKISATESVNTTTLDDSSAALENEQELRVKPLTQASTERQTENSNVVNAFSSIDLSPVSQNEAVEKPLTEIDLINSLVVKSDTTVANNQEKLTPQLTPETTDQDDISMSASKDDLDINQIIDDMLDEDSKPAKLRSARSPHEKLSSTDNMANTQSVNFDDANASAEQADIAATEVIEFNDFDDVEFDKLLEEISVESQSLPNRSNVTQLRRSTEPNETYNTDAKNTEAKPDANSNHLNEVKIDSLEEFISVNELIEESESAAALDESILDDHEIDVGLDEFPEFTSNINHVNVDDDKHGVNAKLDLAHVYIEIGDLDNASVILKSVMKLGNSAQQQQAQQLLYSIK